MTFSVSDLNGNACVTLHLASYEYNTPPYIAFQDFYVKNVKNTTPNQSWRRTMKKAPGHNATMWRPRAGGLDLVLFLDF